MPPLDPPAEEFADDRMPPEGTPPSWRIGPTPDWVDPVAVGFPVAGTTALVLHDSQYNHLLEPRVHIYRRLIFRVRDAADIERLAITRLDLNADQTEVVIHAVDVYRGRQLIKYIDPGWSRTTPWTHRAKPAEAGPRYILRDAQPALWHRIPDLKVGDFVELAHTCIEPIDPLLAGRILGQVSFVCRETTQWRRVRLLLPARPLRVRMIGTSGRPTQKRTGDAIEMACTFKDPPMLAPTLDHPRLCPSHPQLQYSDLASWDELVELLRPHYECAEVPDELARTAERIALAHPTARARALAAIRHVQDEFAYTHADARQWLLSPKPLARVLAEREGDCKAKSTLLVALLRALAVPAAAVFVDQDGSLLDPGFPAMQQLDHVVVMLTVDGREYFVDPAERCQRGDLDNLPSLRVLWGLPLVAGRGPIRIPHECDHPDAMTEFTVDFRVETPGRPARVRYRRRDRDRDANTIREVLRGEASGFFQVQLGRAFAALYPGEVAVADVAARDHAASNTHEMTAELRLAGAWRTDPAGEPGLLVYPIQLLDDLGYYIEQPLRLHHRELCMSRSWTATLELPFAARVQGGGFELELPGLQVRHAVEVGSTRLVVRTTAKLCSHAVADADAVLTALRELPARVQVVVRQPARAPVRAPAARKFRPRFR